MLRVRSAKWPTLHCYGLQELPDELFDDAPLLLELAVPELLVEAEFEVPLDAAPEDLLPELSEEEPD